MRDLLLEWEEARIYRGAVAEAERDEQRRLLQELGLQPPAEPPAPERATYTAKKTGDPVIDLLEEQLARGEEPDLSLL